jgi:hypothetical protein
MRGVGFAAALLALALSTTGCEDEPASVTAPRMASFVDSLEGADVFDVIVWRSVKLEAEAFVLSADDQVEVLMTDQTVDPETERTIQVFRVKHAKGTGWVEARFVRR